MISKTLAVLSDSTETCDSAAIGVFIVILQSRRNEIVRKLRDKVDTRYLSELQGSLKEVDLWIATISKGRTDGKLDDYVKTVIGSV